MSLISTLATVTSVDTLGFLSSLKITSEKWLSEEEKAMEAGAKEENSLQKG